MATQDNPSPEALQRYWAENPGSFETAIAKDPDPFNAALTKYWAENPGSFDAGIVDNNTPSPEALERYWKANPGSYDVQEGLDSGSLETALEKYWTENPGSFEAAGGTPPNYDGFGPFPPGYGGGGGGGGYTPGGGGGGGGGDPFTPPQGSGGGGGGGGGGYDWGFEGGTSGAPPLFGGGGYDPEDFNFERYVPGQESPWGVPGIEGGNKDFYRNQFMNLLRGEQNFQEAETGAALTRLWKQDNPVDATPFDWGSVGVAPPQVAEYDPASGGNATQVMRDWITPGETTNYQIFEGLRDRNLINGADLEGYMGGDANNPNRTSTDLSWATSPSQRLSYLPEVGPEMSQGLYDFHKSVADNMFTKVGLESPEGGGPITRPGYALPVKTTAGSL